MVNDLNREQDFFAQILFAYTEANQWHPGIGDPTFMGWVTVAMYFLAALLCARAAFALPPRSLKSQERVFWFFLCVVLLFLGVNKQLDLQTWLTLTGKRVAIAQGWYEQ